MLGGRRGLALQVAFRGMRDYCRLREENVAGDGRLLCGMMSVELSFVFVVATEGNGIFSILPRVPANRVSWRISRVRIRRHLLLVFIVSPVESFDVVFRHLDVERDRVCGGGGASRGRLRVDVHRAYQCGMSSD